MSHWTPDYKLTIGGVDYTAEAIANISHLSGRNSIYSQPTASQLTIEVVDLDGLAHDFAVNDGVTLQVKDSTNAYVTLFGGNITDVTTLVKKAGTVQNIISYKIIALGALAKLNRATTEGVLTKDYDGNQIYTILSALLYDTWSEVSAAETWATYPATTTWANASNSGIGEIDQPGDYELHARSSSVTNVYSLVSALATSGLGYIYEDSNGRICYADSTHRGQYLATNGYVDIDANKALAEGMQVTAKASDVRNSITIGYKNNQTTAATDSTSIGIYGLLASNITTSLETLTDAQTQANFYLTLRAYPEANMNAITFAIANPELSDSDRDSLLNIFMGMPLNIMNLPIELEGGSFQGFVEGWSWRSSYNNLFITIYLSPLSYSLQAFAWQDVPGTETWNTLSTTMDWLNATIVS